ncbi:MAG: IS30 family transposase [Candidatus Omnitrophica bacterium]|nr:IS30 family transposase [Candidatus Omnitrophota bacterium]
MKQRDYNTNKKRYTHLVERDRYKIEVLLEGKKDAGEIAKLLGRDRSTIYREIKRGTISRLQSDLSEKEKYRANYAQADYDKQGRRKERSLKIGKDSRLEAYIRIKLVEERFSPDAIIGEIKAKGMEFKGIICTKTLYNYIDAGIFSGISNKHLWEKRKKKKRKYKTVVRVNSKNRQCRSIEERPKEINNRVEYGHWEGDTIKGPQGALASLFTLTERKTKEEIIIKVKQATQEAIKAAVDGLETTHGDNFKVKFKSITFDNGSEFLDWKSLEISSLKPAEQRMTVYFAHSYSSWERGTNENQNRMIRRFAPKGTDMADVSEKDVQKIQDWMNNYPRKILGYKTANQMAKECLQGKQLVLKLRSGAL